MCGIYTPTLLDSQLTVLSSSIVSQSRYELAAMKIQNRERDGEGGEGGPTINGLALFLAWTGMVISLVLSFGAATTYFNPDEVFNLFGSCTRFLAVTQFILSVLLFRFYFLLR